MFYVFFFLNITLHHFGCSCTPWFFWVNRHTEKASVWHRLNSNGDWWGKWAWAQDRQTHFYNMFKEGPRLLEDNNVRFAVMKLISCNGAESNSFTDASFAGWEQSTIFSSIYRGVCFSEKKKKWKNANNDELEQLQGPSKHALLCLNKFYKTKGEFNLSIWILLIWHL